MQLSTFGLSHWATVCILLSAHENHGSLLTGTSAKKHLPSTVLGTLTPPAYSRPALKCVSRRSQGVFREAKMPKVVVSMECVDRKEEIHLLCPKAA